jgi:hypothetical protein
LRNDTETGRRFLGLDLRTARGASAAGGRVIVATEDRTWTLPLVAGGSYLSESDPRLLVGLGDAAAFATVEVHWPSGQVDRWEQMVADQYWVLREGQPPTPWFGPDK